MVAAGSHQLDSPRDSENFYFIGIAGAVTIFLLLIVIAIVVINRRYCQKIEAPVDLNEHIYDIPDLYDLRPSLPPRQSKLQTTDQLLCSEDRKQLKDSSIEDAQNCTKMEPNWNFKEEMKEASCDHTQLTGNNCCHQLVPSDNPEGNASPSIPVKVNGTTMHILDHTERMEELCGPVIANSSKLPVFNVLPSRQTSGSEQVQGDEKIHHYEQIQDYEKIQRYEKIQHCDVNLAQLVGGAQVEIAATPASTLALSARSSEDISQAQCHLADSCHGCKEHNLEISLTACKNQDIENIMESNFIRDPIALDSASVQIESSVVPDVCESEGLQENDMETCFEGSIANSNSGGYEQISRYERIEHYDINLAHMLSPTTAAAEDVVNTASSE